MRQLLTSGINDVMHESVNPNYPSRFTRAWFEWANALFVLYVEITLGVRCDAVASARAKEEASKIGVGHAGQRGVFFEDPFITIPRYLIIIKEMLRLSNMIKNHLLTRKSQK